MRHATIAAAVFAFSLYVSTQCAQAHGPGGGGHAGGGQAHIAANATPGNGFRGGELSGLPGGGSTGSGSGKPRPNVNQLHPPTTNGINGSGSTSSSGGSAGGSSSSTSTNLTSGGNTPPAGEIAKIHHLEQELRRLKMEEAMQLLQRAKQSNNPQLIAKAEQALQHLEQHRNQQGGNAGTTAQGNQNAVKPTPVLSGHAGGQAHVSHSSPSGGHAGGGGKR
jgi:hypothetical protein